MWFEDQIISDNVFPFLEDVTWGPVVGAYSYLPVDFL